MSNGNMKRQLCGIFIKGVKRGMSSSLCGTCPLLHNKYLLFCNYFFLCVYSVTNRFSTTFAFLLASLSILSHFSFSSNISSHPSLNYLPYLYAYVFNVLSSFISDMTCHYDIICFSPESEDYDLQPLEIRDVSK